MNNNYILYTIIILFLLLGWALPFVQTEFSISGSITDYNKIYETGEENITINDATSSQTVSTFKIITSIGSMFFWTFGNLPVIIDILFIPLRLMLYVILYDKIRGIN